MQNKLEKLYESSIKKMILDTDTYNEADDQYAIAYAMLSPDRVELLSVNAAPFFNENSDSPADGMEKSYHEAIKIMHMVDPHTTIPVYRGSEGYLKSKTEYQPSDACDNIIRTVMESDETVYIVAIGAITNVASAIIKCPAIIRKAVVVWLGGTALHYPSAEEFNLRQDVIAVQVVLDSGIPFVRVPCCGVCHAFYTTMPELRYFLEGKNELCDYLIKITSIYGGNHVPWSKVLWDITAVAALVCPQSMEMAIRPTPVLTDDMKWDTSDATRHGHIDIYHINRDPIFMDLFPKFAKSHEIVL